MRALLYLLIALVAACKFSGPTDKPPGDDAAPPMIDAPPDGIPDTCGAAGERACDGRLRRECGADHQWDPALDVACQFTCVAGACVAASNVPMADIATCGPSAPRLAPPVGATVVIQQTGIACSPNCGDAATTLIAPTVIGGTPGLAWFCLSSVDLASVNVVLPPTGGPAAAIAFIVDGSISIGSTFDFDGHDGSSGAAGGEGAPGAFDGGGGLSNVEGPPGGGPCGGTGGGSTLSPNEAGGGGGGGGGVATGGAGGKGLAPNNTTQAPGGPGGGVCGIATLSPIVGGSGGGGGGDGSCTSCGWAGGGGGGAIQLSSRIAITIAGVVRARGGAGFGIASGAGSTGGGGGGGAGGAILLEAPAIAVTGSLTVDGGAGGASNAGPGGAGARGAAGAGNGASEIAADQGGAGGGGAGGRIHVSSPNASCSAASPVASCSTGTLVVVD